MNEKQVIVFEKVQIPIDKVGLYLPKRKSITILFFPGQIVKWMLSPKKEHFPVINVNSWASFHLSLPLLFFYQLNDPQSCDLILVYYTHKLSGKLFPKLLILKAKLV